ncbi:MAG: hypothetical protein KA998_00875 [Rickettsiaceae bacterium]|nr:hypothetical protein [Rickettsiaceae bacterium]
MPFNEREDRDLMDEAETNPQILQIANSSSTIKNCYRTGLIDIESLLTLKELHANAFLTLVNAYAFTNGDLAFTECKKITNNYQLQALKSGKASVDEAVALCPNVLEASRAKAEAIKIKNITVAEANNFTKEIQVEAFKAIYQKIDREISMTEILMSASKDQLEEANIDCEDAQNVLAMNPDDKEAKEKLHQAQIVINYENFAIENSEKNLQLLQSYFFKNEYIMGKIGDFNQNNLKAFKIINQMSQIGVNNIEWLIETAKRFDSENQVIALDLTRNNKIGVKMAPKISLEEQNMIPIINSGNFDPEIHEMMKSAMDNSGGDIHISYLIEHALKITKIGLEALRAGVNIHDANKFTSMEQVDRLKGVFTPEYASAKEASAKAAFEHYREEKAAYDAQYSAYKTAKNLYMCLEAQWKKDKALNPSFDEPEPVAPEQLNIGNAPIEPLNERLIYPTEEMVREALGVVAAEE